MYAEPPRENENAVRIQFQHIQERPMPLNLNKLANDTANDIRDAFKQYTPSDGIPPNYELAWDVLVKRVTEAVKPHLTQAYEAGKLDGKTKVKTPSAPPTSSRRDTDAKKRRSRA